MRRALKRAGLENKAKPWKSIRATFASRKAEDGVDVPSIAALMGLTTAHVFEHYFRPTGLHLEAAMADRRSRRAATGNARKA
jgi:site-specific recombinase XerD